VCAEVCDILGAGMAKLNDTEIGKLRWDTSKRTRTGKVPGYQSVNDPEVGGLHLRILPPKATTGQSAKVFWLGYGPSTGRKFYRIGEFGNGSWSLKAARREARRLRSDFYDHGVDPNKSKRKRIRDAEARLTVGQLVEAYLQEHEPAWADSYTRNNRGHAKRLVAAHGGQYAEDLTRDDVRPVFLRIKKATPSQADLFRTFGRGLFNWALDWKRVPEMPNPFVLERGNSTAKSQFKIERRVRTRHLEYKKGEATQLFDLLSDYDNRSRSDAQSYLTIAWRNQELREARYEDIDHGQGTIRNVAPKGGPSQEYTSPLTDTVYQLLESLGDDHIQFRKGPLFPGQARDGRGNLKPITDWGRWRRVISKDARMPVCPTEGHITLHDLRRSAITWLQQMGVTVEDRTIFKGSKPQGLTERTYSQGDRLDIRRRCAQLIENRIRDVEAGNEKSMFDQWRTLTRAAGSAQ